MLITSLCFMYIAVFLCFIYVKKSVSNMCVIYLHYFLKILDFGHFPS